MKIIEDQFGLLKQSKFHHIGYASKSIDEDLLFFKSLGFNLEGKIFTDTNQGIRGCFIVGCGTRIELLENLPNSQTLSGLIRHGINMYHLAYEVDSIKVAFEKISNIKHKVIVQPISAVAFGGRKIAFVLFRNNFILEFIEK